MNRLRAGQPHSGNRLRKDVRLKKLVWIVGILQVLIGCVEGHAQEGVRQRLEVFSRYTRLRYNRVEGLFAGYHLAATPKAWKGIRFFAEVGYGLHNQKPRWEGGVDYDKGKRAFTFVLFDRTETNDRETVRSGENSLYALLYKGDYRDYFRAKYGFEAKGSYRYTPRLLLVGRLTAYTYESMPDKTQWSLFRRDSNFRSNPAVRPGRIGLLQTGFIYDTQSRGPLFRNAWYLSAFYERGFQEFGYNGFILHAKRYQKVVVGSQAIVAQCRIGSRESAYEQHRFDLGGVSTLRGYRIKEFTGNRMAMLNIDYLFRGDILGRVPLKGVNLLQTILFFDTGWTSLAARHTHLLNGFQELRLSDFKSDLGLAVALPHQIFRVNIACRLDGGDPPWVFSVRFMRKL